MAEEGMERGEEREWEEGERGEEEEEMAVEGMERGEKGRGEEKEVMAEEGIPGSDTSGWHKAWRLGKHNEGLG